MPQVLLYSKRSSSKRARATFARTMALPRLSILPRQASCGEFSSSFWLRLAALFALWSSASYCSVLAISKEWRFVASRCSPAGFCLKCFLFSPYFCILRYRLRSPIPQLLAVRPMLPPQSASLCTRNCFSFSRSHWDSVAEAISIGC